MANDDQPTKPDSVCLYARQILSRGFSAGLFLDIAQKCCFMHTYC